MDGKTDHILSRTVQFKPSFKIKQSLGMSIEPMCFECIIRVPGETRFARLGVEI